MNSISAIVIAAGLSSRMGAFKPLMEIDGAPAILKLLSTIEKADVEEIIVVTGHKSDELTDVIEKYAAASASTKRIKTVFNANYNEGMFTSIQSGLRKALEKNDSLPDAVLLFPVDSPLVSLESISILIETWKSNRDEFFVPCYRGKKGHPLLIPSEYFEEILAHDGQGGLKAITQKHEHKMTLIETEDEGVVIDMDTQNDYSYALSRNINLELGIGNGLAGTSKIILVRHGSNAQHKEKIFLGQTDIPLSELGRSEAQKAGAKLKEMNLNNPSIWSSSLSRAKETAEIIAESIWESNAESNKNQANDGLNNGKTNVHESNVQKANNVTCVESLNEICLGAWDGKYISEIMSSFPEEYKRRGRDILRYKQGNDAENFYDLRYRVIRAFEEIIEGNNDGEDIIIVTHAGPIRMIIAEYSRISLGDALKIKIPRAIPLQIDGQLW